MTDRYPESGRQQRKAGRTGEPARASYVTDLDKGWLLSVVQQPNGGITARVALRDHAYELTTPDTTMVTLPSFGYTARLTFDQNGVPCVVWAQEGGGSPFVWFCAVGVAAWSTPVMDDDYS